jgi:hypothetical protein
VRKSVLNAGESCVLCVFPLIQVVTIRDDRKVTIYLLEQLRLPIFKLVVRKS